MAKKILAVVAEPISPEILTNALGEQAREAEVLVIAPALNSRTRWLVDDPDPAIERAQQVQEESVDRLADADIDAAGDTGEADPVQAIEDTLTTYAADEIMLVTHADGEHNWLEKGVVDEASQRFEEPVTHFVVE